MEIIKAVKQIADTEMNIFSVQDVLESTTRLFDPVDAGLITIFNEEMNYDEVIAVFNHDWQVVSNVHMSSGQGATGWAYATKTPHIWTGHEATTSLLDTIEPKARKLLSRSNSDIDHLSLMVAPLEVRGKVIGAIQLEHISDDRQFSELELQMLVHLVATPLAIALERSGFVEAMERDHVRVRNLLQKIIRAREEEREHIARDLHDNIAQTLAGLHIALENLQHIASAMPNSESLKSYFQELDEEVRNTIDATQNLVFELRPAMLDDFGLAGALTWYLEERFAKAGIEVNLNIQEGNQKLEETIAITLFRVAQEALSNTLRHANAKSITCSLDVTDDRAQLVISDDGVGFSFDERQKANYFLGIRGMEERMSMIGGTLVIDSRTSVGSTVTATVFFSESFDD